MTLTGPLSGSLCIALSCTVHVLRLVFAFCPLFIGKVVIDAFRLTDPRMQALGQEPRQTTSNLGHLEKPSIQVPLA